jgi:hypothetical protein
MFFSVLFFLEQRLGRTELVRLKQTNQLQCLRLAARCAMAIYSVRAEIADAGIVGIAQEVHGPVMKLNECIEMVSSCCVTNRVAFCRTFDFDLVAGRATILFYIVFRVWVLTRVLQAHKFLLKLNRRPFIKRFLQSDEIKFTHVTRRLRMRCRCLASVASFFFFC